MTEEKTEAISYSLPTLVFEKETSWLDLSKLKILANKSFLTNLISAIVFGASYVMPEFVGRQALMMASLFALSGALTNWLAVYMLFERIPGLYGSGIITCAILPCHEFIIVLSVSQEIRMHEIILLFEINVIDTFVNYWYHLFYGKYV